MILIKMERRGDSPIYVNIEQIVALEHGTNDTNAITVHLSSGKTFISTETLETLVKLIA